MTSIYLDLLSRHTSSYNKHNKKYQLLALLRLTVGVGILFTIYYAYNLNSIPITIVGVILFIIFILLVRFHSILKTKRTMSKTLMDINSDEINFLDKTNISYKNGSEFINTSHAFSYDLDLFGDNSLFQQLNRTATSIGHTNLSERLLSQLPNEEILHSHKAIQELGPKVSYRQEINGLARIANDNNEAYARLINWSKLKPKKSSIAYLIISYLFPVLFVMSCGLYFYYDTDFWYDMISRTFILNLIMLMFFYKRIKTELDKSSKIDEIIKNYSLILKYIEEEKFESAKLISLQKQLVQNGISSSKQIKKLSSLFAQLDNISNPIGAIIMNGVSQYHIHVMRALENWRLQHADDLNTWLNVIGEIETLNSLANFSHNNPSYCFPDINTKLNINFKDLGHPFIKEQERVNNDISFNQERFVILTGSNMSGKSTFLRSLGINMVLASSGSPICATKANIHPLPIWVSMRLSDNLNENESYFFAEVKRLKEIMSHADSVVNFILLDEILRGTNSDDKRLGTIEVIKRLVGNQSIGAIATHDLEVCETTNDYPNILTNKCFEVEIIDNELSFDYKLREGICKNKSATFLMRKMEVI